MAVKPNDTPETDDTASVEFHPNAFKPDDWFRTGSRVICTPPVMDTDEDFVLLFNYRDFEKDLNGRGFIQDGLPKFYTGNDNGGFKSFRRGNINLITTRNKEFFELFRTATVLAKHFNLTEKSDRISLFQAVLYGVKSHNLQLVYHPPRPTEDALRAENERLREALQWYEEQSRLCRLIHSGGNIGRQSLSDDGGDRARAALKEQVTE